MKKLFCLLIAFGLLISIASAIPMPAPVTFYFTFDGKPIQNFQVKLSTGGEEITRITNNLGGVQVDVGTEGSPDFRNVGLTLTLNCGFEVCNKVYDISELRKKPYKEKFELTERPPVTCPPCPPCSCGGGGSSGGGGVIIKCTEEKCREEFPCSEPKCPEDLTPYEFCNTCCTEEECKDIVCPECKEPEPCEEIIVPQGLTGNQILIWILTLIGVAGGGIFAGKFITRDRISKIRNVTYRVRVERDGDIVEEHRHAGLKSYHSIHTSHRDALERHPKGEKFPLYEKNDEGKYVYQGD